MTGSRRPPEEPPRDGGSEAMPPERPETSECPETPDTPVRRTEAWARRLRRPAKYVAFVLVAVAGIWLGLYLGAATSVPVGPVDTTMRLVPAANGQTSVMIPPLGTLLLDSHKGPLRLDVTVDQIDESAVRQIMHDPRVLDRLRSEVTDDLRADVTATLVRGLIAGTLGAAFVTLLVFRRIRPTVVVAGASAGALLVAYGIAGLTWNPRAITEPRFEGLLSSAPSLIGNAEDIAENFDAYSEQLARLVGNVTKLYDVTSTLPSYDPDDVIKVLHISDLHLGAQAWDVIESVVRQYDIDVIVDSGDLTDHGTAAENAFFTSTIPRLGVPYVWVRGNHDSMVTEAAMRKLKNVVVLDGKVRTVDGIRFLGAGDPVFTPDRSHRDVPDEEEAVARQAQALVRVSERQTDPVDAIVYHDPAGASFLDGHAPLVLCGHRHVRLNLLMPRGSRLMQEGTTGGGGLRAFENPGGKPAPMEMSVLYIGKSTKTLEAWDEITLGGLGLSSADLERHQVDPNEGKAPVPSPAPTPTGPVPTTPVPEPTISDFGTVPPSLFGSRTPIFGSRSPTSTDSPPRDTAASPR